MARIRPKNWADFQHYKDRDPSWIKLHKRLLDDFEFQSLPVASRALAPMLWLLASEEKTGLIDAEDRKLAFRLRMTPAELDEALRPLVQGGFFVAERAASGPLAEPDRPAILQVEKQVKDKKEEQLPVEAAASKQKSYPEAFEQFWKAYPTDNNMPKKPAFKAWGRLAPEKQTAAFAAIPGFKAYCAANSWYRPIYADRFLSQEKFEGYAATPADEAVAEAARTAWDGAAAPLVAEIGAAAFQAYFASTEFEPGPPAHIRGLKPHLRDIIARKFPAQLKRAFGEVQLEAA